MKKKTIRTALLAGVAATLAGIATLGFSCAATPSDIGMRDGQLRPCPDSPNCVCSEGEDAGVEPLAYTGDGKTAFQSLLDHLELQSNVEIVTIEEGYAHAVYRTKVLRFRDDLELRLDEENSVIHVRSASRVGHSDMGANRRRVEELRASWSSSNAE